MPAPTFTVSGAGIEFYIPDDWCRFCDMVDFAETLTVRLHQSGRIGFNPLPNR